MIGFCQFGAGRIGATHAGNIASRHDARLQFVVDPDRAAAERLAGRYGAAVSSRVEALADPSVNAVVIASSTDTHADLVADAASVLIDPAIGEAGDVDTAVVTLRTQSGALCQISNSRRAIYGYDQRIEALGAKGALRAENVVKSTVSFAGDDGIISDKPLHFFL